MKCGLDFIRSTPGDINFIISGFSDSFSTYWTLRPHWAWKASLLGVFILKNLHKRKTKRGGKNKAGERVNADFFHNERKLWAKLRFMCVQMSFIFFCDAWVYLLVFVCGWCFGTTRRLKRSSAAFFFKVTFLLFPAWLHWKGKWSTFSLYDIRTPGNASQYASCHWPLGSSHSFFVFLYFSFFFSLNCNETNQLSHSHRNTNSYSTTKSIESVLHSLLFFCLIVNETRLVFFPVEKDTRGY